MQPNTVYVHDRHQLEGSVTIEVRHQDEAASLRSAITMIGGEP